jgi:hypothetical protein
VTTSEVVKKRSNNPHAVSSNQTRHSVIRHEGKSRKYSRISCFLLDIKAEEKMKAEKQDIRVEIR